MIKQISPLRQRMIDDIAFRYMSPNTQKVDRDGWDGRSRHQPARP